MSLVPWQFISTLDLNRRRKRLPATLIGAPPLSHGQASHLLACPPCSIYEGWDMNSINTVGIALTLSLQQHKPTTATTRYPHSCHFQLATRPQSCPSPQTLLVRRPSLSVSVLPCQFSLPTWSHLPSNNNFQPYVFLPAMMPIVFNTGCSNAMTYEATDFETPPTHGKVGNWYYCLGYFGYQWLWDCEMESSYQGWIDGWNSNPVSLTPPCYPAFNFFTRLCPLPPNVYRKRPIWRNLKPHEDYLGIWKTTGSKHRSPSNISGIRATHYTSATAPACSCATVPALCMLLTQKWISKTKENTKRWKCKYKKEKKGAIRFLIAKISDWIFWASNYQCMKMNRLLAWPSRIWHATSSLSHCPPVFNNAIVSMMDMLPRMQHHCGIFDVLLQYHVSSQVIWTCAIWGSQRKECFRMNIMSLNDEEPKDRSPQFI